jgi:alanyl-tRNA synthetase
MPTGSEIRRKFLDFFVQKGHKEVHSSSLVPANDPTLLFTNAGMNQFKDVFLGLEKRDYLRATTSQKCVRAGGKHNDLENVGFTNRHHTFFEMLGNFSFGDYFKKDAIAYAWELITSPEWFGVDRNKLYVTIFNGEGGVPRDAEAYDLWAAQGVSKDRIFEMGAKDNFWQMGDTGPCGPCSEIYYDMGVAASDSGHADCAFPCDCGRYVEIWNLVFMQFDRDASGKLNPLPKPSIDTGMGLERTAAVLQGVISNYETDLFTPLIKRAAELTGVGYQDGRARTDASLRIIADHSRAATFLISDGVTPSNDGRGYVLRKILRRALRHGRFLRLPFEAPPFMDQMVYSVRNLMGEAYPELLQNSERIAEVVRREERQFHAAIGKGLDHLQQLIRSTRYQAFVDAMKNLPTEDLIFIYGANIVAAAKRFADGDILTKEDWGEFARGLFGSHAAVVLEIIPNLKVILPGDKAFSLYETYGLPRDFIEEAARDQGLTFDTGGFERALAEEQVRARTSWKGAAKQSANPAYLALASANHPIASQQGLIEPGTSLAVNSRFEGYLRTRTDDCRVVAMMRGGRGVSELNAGEEGEVILDHTPFYAESGGQVGDRGWFYSDDHNTVIADVKGCYSPVQGVRAHQVVVKSPHSAVGESKSPLLAQNAREKWGTLRVGDKVDAVVDAERRVATMRNHTATHLLHAGLREILGKHVKQAGSLVAPDHLRFDFSHFTGVEDEELQDIEDLINKELLRNIKVETLTDVPIDEAINKYHAMALFGEKYGDKVRVVRIGDFSTELCGGTHTAATGEIGLIKILKEGSVSSGVRRVEAVTGEGSLLHFRRDHELENVVSGFASSHPSKTAKGGAAPSDLGSDSETSFSPAEALKAELEKKDNEIKRLTRELDQARMKSASASTGNIGERVKEVKGVKVLAHRVDNLERGQLRTLVDQLRDKIGSGVVILGSASNGNVALIVGVTKDLTGRVQAGKVIGPVAQKVGGKGGGRPDLAEAGGKDASALDAALDGAYGVVEEILG